MITNKIITKKNKTYNRKTIKSSHSLIIGCHASIVPDILSGIKYVAEIGGNAVQIFLGSKTTASLKMKHKFGTTEISDVNEYITKNKITLIIHSIYNINFCKFPHNSGRIQYAHKNLQYDLKYGALLGAKCVVLHLGFKNNIDINIAIENLIGNINKIIRNMPKGIMLSLETSAGRGSEVGWNLEELARIWNGITTRGASALVGICIDTAHIFVSGYDISTVAGISKYMNKFDSLIGIKNITNFHINDSRFALGEKRNEHRGIGKGLIYNSEEGKKALLYIKKICMKHKIPMVLETHSAGSATSEGSHKGDHGYEYEIDMIKTL